MENSFLYFIFSLKYVFNLILILKFMDYAICINYKVLSYVKYLNEWENAVYVYQYAYTNLVNWVEIFIYSFPTPQHLKKIKNSLL